jgi:hypothetical protein
LPGKFPSVAPGRGPERAEPSEPYQYAEPNAFTRIGPNFVSNGRMDPNIPEPLNFDEPEPEDRHDADGAKVNVMKSKYGSTSGDKRVTPGTFRGCADMSSTS